MPPPFTPLRRRVVERDIGSHLTVMFEIDAAFVEHRYRLPIALRRVRHSFGRGDRGDNG